jgi:hypothetical protein
MTRSPRPPIGPLPDDPSEKAVLARVRLLFHDVGCTTYSTVQTRRSRQAIGLPDLWVMSPRLGGFWFECKRPGGKQSPAQVAFQHACQLCAVDYVKGGTNEAIAYLQRRGLLGELSGSIALVTNPRHRW